MRTTFYAILFIGFSGILAWLAQMPNAPVWYGFLVFPFLWTFCLIMLLSKYEVRAAVDMRKLDIQEQCARCSDPDCPTKQNDQDGEPDLEK